MASCRPSCQYSPIMNKEFFRFERAAWESHQLLAGLDEAGRGAWAGPVVAAAVIFAKDCRIDGIDDSKKVSPAKREKLYEQIISSCLTYGVGVIDSQTVDRVNILEATKMAMLVALRAMNPQPDFLLIDGNMTLATTIGQQSIIDGDALSFTIAAASILAKVTRDRLMRELAVTYPDYGFDKHKGYGTQEHQNALQRVGCSPIHRFTYRPVAAIASMNKEQIYES